MEPDFTDPDEILSALGALLVNRPALFLVVIGGSAIAANGLIARTTRDVDVIGQALRTAGGLVFSPLHEWPDWLTEAAAIVRRDFGLSSDWLNTEAADVTTSLPAGFMGRLLIKPYGQSLTVGFASRFDLIHLKLLASMQGEERHFQDLERFRPTAVEIREAAAWLLSIPAIRGAENNLRSLVERLGYELSDA